MTKSYVEPTVDDLGVVQSLVMGGGPVEFPDFPDSPEPPRPDESVADFDE